MIGVLTLFGETDLQPVLTKLFDKNNICFIQSNCVTSVQLQLQIEEYDKVTDVIIINANAVNMETLGELVSDIRSREQRMRIILILNGTPENYIRQQLMEYKERKLDIIFDNKGFDASELLELVKGGKLPKKTVKPIKVIKEKFEIEETSESEIPEPAYTRKSFSHPEGSYSIGVMNLTHGAGATTTTIMTARFFALQNYKTAVMDFSGTNSLEYTKKKDISYVTDEMDISEVMNRFNVTVIDFGTPYRISPTGDDFVAEHGYNINLIKQLFNCNIKIVMCFDDDWHINKLKYIMNNDVWHSKIDTSFIFLVPKDSEKIKSKYPDVNIYDRNSDYRELILEEIWRDD